LPATRQIGNAPLTLIAGKPAPTGDRFGFRQGDRPCLPLSI